jgi:hypothetical protein
MKDDIETGNGGAPRAYFLFDKDKDVAEILGIDEM